MDLTICSIMPREETKIKIEGKAKGMNRTRTLITMTIRTSTIDMNLQPILQIEMRTITIIKTAIRDKGVKIKIITLTDWKLR